MNDKFKELIKGIGMMLMICAIFAIVKFVGNLILGVILVVIIKIGETIF